MKSEVIGVATGRRESVHDITAACAKFTASAAGGGDGLLHVFVPHATAGLARAGRASRADAVAAMVREPSWPGPDRRQGAATAPRKGFEEESVSATARQAQDQQGLAERLGIKPGQVVQEIGYDDDCDEQ